MSGALVAFLQRFWLVGFYFLEKINGWSLCHVIDLFVTSLTYTIFTGMMLLFMKILACSFKQREKSKRRKQLGTELPCTFFSAQALCIFSLHCCNLCYFEHLTLDKLVEGQLVIIRSIHLTMQYMSKEWGSMDNFSFNYLYKIYFAIQSQKLVIELFGAILTSTEPLSSFRVSIVLKMFRHITLQVCQTSLIYYVSF